MVRFFIVSAFKYFFFHFVNANWIFYYFSVASDLLVLRVIKILILIKHLKLFDNPHEDLSSLLQSAVRAAIFCSVKGSLILLISEIAITHDMNPFAAICIIALDPFSVDLFHAYIAILVLFIVFVAA